MKTKLIPFDAEKAKNGAKVVTRNGMPAKILDYPVKNEDSPILGLILIEGKEFPKLFTKNGNHYSDCTESRLDLFIEEEVEEDDSDYDPYKEVVKSIADMVERYSAFGSDLVDFYDNVKVKCREAVEYEKKWNKEQEEQKPSDEFKIMPDKWYVCTLGWESCGWDGDWKFVEGSTYLGSEILQCYPMDEKEIQDHVRLWTICDAKPGDILATKNGYNILIFKNIKSSSGSGFSSYYNYNNFSDYSDFKEGSWSRDRFTPATKEQCDILFQKIKEEGYEWYSTTNELKKIDNKLDNGGNEDALKAKKEPKFRIMTRQELAWWLKDHPENHREFRYSDSATLVYNSYTYFENEAHNECPSNFLIRENGGEWKKPLIED